MIDNEMNNTKPKDRSERIANRNRDNIEKAYLQDRVGMFNKPAEKARINDPDPMSDIYISEGERFNKDFAAYDYEKRCRDHQKKKDRYQTLQSILFDRERKRWEKMDYDYLRNENKIMMNKERNLVGRKNNPGMAFNPITLQYDNSVQGEILKKRDEESKYRALMRASNIDKHTNAGYNILTGEDRLIMQRRMQNEIDPNLYQQNIGAIREMNKNQHNKTIPFYDNPKSPNMQMQQYNPPPQYPSNEYIPPQYSNNNNQVMSPNNEYINQNNNNQIISPNNNQLPPNDVYPNQPVPYRNPTPSNNMPMQYTPNEPYPNQNMPYRNPTPNNNYPQMGYREPIPNRYQDKGLGYENSKNGFDMYNQGYDNQYNKNINQQGNMPMNNY